MPEATASQLSDAVQSAKTWLRAHPRGSNAEAAYVAAVASSCSLTAVLNAIRAEQGEK